MDPVQMRINEKQMEINNAQMKSIASLNRQIESLKSDVEYLKRQIKREKGGKDRVVPSDRSDSVSTDLSGL